MHLATDLDAFLPRLETLARRAGDIALHYYRPGERTTAEVTYKGGGSPVTEADFAVDRFLFDEMRSLAPDAAWLSEETADTNARLAHEAVIIVDPIDGTLAFTRGDERWAVSIALVEFGRPTAGVIHAPALGETFIAARGVGAYLNGVRLEAPQPKQLRGARIVGPKGMRDVLAEKPEAFVLAERTPSLALRLAHIAAGRHDIVVAGPNARDWDIAAADIVLAESNARLAEPDGDALTYNRASLARRALIAAPNSLFDNALAFARTLAEGR